MIRPLTTADLVPYQRLSFRYGGRGPDAYDCWGLVRLVYAEVLGIDLPSGADDYPVEHDTRSQQARLEAGQRPWRRIAARSAPSAPVVADLPPQSGDVALLRRGQFLGHVGLLLVDESRPLEQARWRLFHIEDDGVHCEPVNRVNARQLMGVFRYL